MVEGTLRDTEHGQRVDDAGQHREEQQSAQRSDVLADEAGKAVHCQIT